MKASIAICTYNRAAVLAETLRFASAQEFPEGEWEVLVIDNASKDNTAEVVKAFRGSRSAPRYIFEGKQGLSHARNRALQEARGDIVVYLDDDTEFPADWLAKLLEPYGRENAARIGLVAGEVTPTFPEGLPRWLEGKWRPLRYSKETARMKDNQLPFGASFSTPRQLCIELGGFRTDLGRTGNSLGGNEDHEYTRRVRAAGYETWFVPGAEVKHLIPASRLTFSYTMRHVYDSSRSRVIERAGRKGSVLPWLLSRMMLYCVMTVAFLLFTALCFVAFQRDAGKRALSRVAKSAGYVRECAAQAWKKGLRRR